MRRRLILFNKLKRNNVIIPHIKERGNIVYGARSIQAQLGLLSRPTEDWDIFSKNPKKDANELQSKLDKQIGFDYFYSKQGVHKGTHKVKGLGFDMKKDTEDDEGIVDFTQMPRPIPSHIILRGMKFRRMKEEIAAKKKAVKDPAYEFRKEKDLGDLRRIETIQRAGNLKVGVNKLRLWKNKCLANQNQEE